MTPDIFLDLRDHALGPDEHDLTLLLVCAADLDEKGIDSTGLRTLIERMGGKDDA